MKFCEWGHIHNTSFFVTCGLAQKVRVFNYSELEMLVRDKHSILLNQFLSYAKQGSFLNMAQFET
jgi:hypothetical protein